jgi:hypothetical protein
MRRQGGMLMSVGFLSSFHLVMGKPPFRTLSLDKERSKETFYIHSLVQRTNQETSTPTEPPPILGGRNTGNRRNRRFPSS